MPVVALGRALVFPPVERAVDGLLAVGGDLSVARLLLAYRSGIFPWYEQGLPILWHSPDPRCVLVPGEIHVGRSLRRTRSKAPYAIRYDTAFREVIRACKTTPRPGQDGTWITAEMEEAYVRLHALGFAHSVEAWEDGALVGGLYGVSIGRVYFGESMFSTRPDASKLALLALAERVSGWGFPFIDAQIPTPHTLALGAVEWPRATFLARLRDAVGHPTRRGSWAAGDVPLVADV